MPKGIGFTASISDPFPVGYTGFWVKDLGGGNTALMVTKPDQSAIAIQEIVESLSSEAQYFSRTKLNNSGATIPAGAPVCIRTDGSIGLADADDESSATFFGITMTSIPDQTSGKVIYTGVVPGILENLGLLSGSYIWLSATPGGMASESPTSENAHLRIIGIVDGNDLILQPQHNGQLGSTGA